jgi:uncharacterized protein YdaU (DUF1376 family)
MHYYQFNIGDYASHTRHLTAIEDIAYRRLLDLYYLHERPLNSGSTSVARQINMREYEIEVKSVLEEFFTLTDDGWINVRADKEIAHYRGKIEQASRAGKASAERRSNARLTDVQLTNNHKPITNIKTNKTLERPDDISEELWVEFKEHRKRKKAVVTELVIKNIRSEASKANMSLAQAMETMIVNGWAGFKSGWIKNTAQTTENNIGRRVL